MQEKEKRREKGEGRGGEGVLQEWGGNRDKY
jgi:hypothetical protein